MNRIGMLLLSCLFCLCMVGCTNENDFVSVCNKSSLVFDDVNIDIKDGYFYNKHEKTIVDDNTVALTIYFTKNDGWE